METELEVQIEDSDMESMRKGINIWMYFIQHGMYEEKNVEINDKKVQNLLI